MLSYLEMLKDLGFNIIKQILNFSNYRISYEQPILYDYIKLNCHVNKGKTIFKKFCEKCRQSASKRGFNGNQFIDKYGNPRQ